VEGETTPKERKVAEFEAIVRPNQTLLFSVLDPNYLFKIAGTQKKQKDFAIG
jgi:hypothetical protein